jgi:hypothetical protein
MTDETNKEYIKIKEEIVTSECQSLGVRPSL